MAASIRNEPGQFNVEISLVGMQVGQGQGAINQVSFSGSGSNNIGVQNSATFDKVTIAPAIEAKAEWAPAVADHLHHLAGLAGSNQTDRSAADELVRGLQALAAPASLIHAVNGLLGIIWPW